MGPKLELEIRIDRGRGKELIEFDCTKFLRISSRSTWRAKGEKKKYETNYPKHFSLQLSVLNPLDGGQAKFTPHANRYPPPPPPPPSNKGND